MTWRHEFPRWSEGCIPSDIPAGFADVSWHNDTKPSFWNKALRLKIWIDHVDLGEREIEEPAERFCLSLTTEDDEWVDDLLFSDDWEAIKARIAAHQATKDS